MGTRSTTVVFDGDHPILAIYRQMDGYWSGHGADLKAFLAPVPPINGISGQQAGAHANGMGCLAAQLVANLKTGIGSIYLTTPDDKQGYHYEIRQGSNGSINLKAFVYDTLGYEGPISEFDPNKEPEDEE